MDEHITARLNNNPTPEQLDAMYRLLKEPIQTPTPGVVHQPRALVATSRQLGKFQVIGVCHNSPNADLEALYFVAHLAARRALIVNAFVTLDEIGQEQAEPAVFVEVGTWCGESAVMIGSALLEVMGSIGGQCRSARLIVVDTFRGTPTDHNAESLRMYGGSIKEMCRDNLEQLECDERGEIFTHIIQGESTAVAAEHFDDESIDFVYIDADHTFDAVLADGRAWFPKLRPGGIMAGHDYNPVLFPSVISAADLLAHELGHCTPLGFDNTTVWFFRKPTPEDHPEE